MEIPGLPEPGFDVTTATQADLETYAKGISSDKTVQDRIIESAKAEADQVYRPENPLLPKVRPPTPQLAKLVGEIHNTGWFSPNGLQSVFAIAILLINYGKESTADRIEPFS